jgi:hypothetical protein
MTCCSSPVPLHTDCFMIIEYGPPVTAFCVPSSSCQTYEPVAVSLPPFFWKHWRSPHIDSHGTFTRSAGVTSSWVVYLLDDTVVGSARTWGTQCSNGLSVVQSFLRATQGYSLSWFLWNWKTDYRIHSLPVCTISWMNRVRILGPYLLISILILSNRLHVGIRSCSLPSNFQTKLCVRFSTSPFRDHLILLQFFILIFVEECKSWCTSLRNVCALLLFRSLGGRGTSWNILIYFIQCNPMYFE